VESVELQALPYHRAVVDHLRAKAPAVWRHFASESYRAEHQEALRLHLLQTTVVLKRESHPEIYEVVDSVAKALQLGVPVELFQAQMDGSMNAALMFQPTVARIVFHGPVHDFLDADEFRALLGHELAHHRLWTLDGGIHLTAQRAVDGMVAMAALESAMETARLLSLSSEVFADRAGLKVSDLDAAVRTLIRMRTGLSNAVAKDFLEQSRELLSKQGTGARGWSHPDAHLRALALEWFAADGVEADPRIRTLLEGPIQLDDLDLLRKEELAAVTRRVVDALLQPEWFRSDAVMGHARLLFDDYEVLEAEIADPKELLAPWGDTVRDFLALILVDFVAVDPQLEDLPLCQAHAVAEFLGLEKHLIKQVNKKLKRTKKVIKAALEERDDKLNKADGSVS